VDYRGIDIGVAVSPADGIGNEDEFGIGLGQTQQRHRFGGTGALPSCSSGRSSAWNAPGSPAPSAPLAARGPATAPAPCLGGTGQDLQPLATRCHIANRLSTISDALSPRRRVFQLDLASITAPSRSDETPSSSREPRHGRDQPGFQLNVDLKSSRSAILVPRIRR